MAALTAPAGGAGQAGAWRDGKRYLWLIGLMVPILPLIGMVLWHHHPLAVYWWFTPLLSFVVLPLTDPLTGWDDFNVPEDAAAALAEDRYYRRLFGYENVNQP